MACELDIDKSNFTNYEHMSNHIRGYAKKELGVRKDATRRLKE